MKILYLLMIMIWNDKNSISLSMHRHGPSIDVDNQLPPHADA